MNILVIEDDSDISMLIAFHLKAQGYGVDTAATGREAVEKIAGTRYALAILDMLLPEIPGIEVRGYIRKESPQKDLPVIVASAAAEESDIITALELGADDYITKPFSPKILIARVRSVIRRSEHREVQGPICTESGIMLNPETRECWTGDAQVILTATEFDILSALIKADGRVMSRSGIIEEIKGDDYPVTERSVDVQIASIRKKLGPSGNAIRTVWGIGYRYAEE